MGSSFFSAPCFSPFFYKFFKTLFSFTGQLLKFEKISNLRKKTDNIFKRLSSVSDFPLTRLEYRIQKQ